MLQTAAVSIADVHKVIESIGRDMAEATEQIGRLAAKYSELSLSGSFSGQVKKSVKLLETHLVGIRNTSDEMNIDQMEASLAQLNKKLRILEVAADAACKKISQPTIVDRLNEGFTRIFAMSSHSLTTGLRPSSASVKLLSDPTARTTLPITPIHY